MKTFYGATVNHKDAVTCLIEEPRHYLWLEYLEALALDPSIEAPASSEPDERFQVWIIGAGGYGRELYWQARSVVGHGRDWTITGYLNDLPDVLDNYPEVPRIQGTTDYMPRPIDRFICSIGDIEGRRNVCHKFLSRGALFFNLVHKGVLQPESCILGKGIVIERGATLATDVTVGDHTLILGNSSLGHDVKVGSYCNISSFAVLLGRCKIGSGVVIGAHAVILPDIEVGDNAVVGAGSVVVRDVKPGETVFGVPARTIKVA
jgi:sugar O-acyltransferase (sialic acid O-acetyltransferase NeuD family)